MFDTIMMMLYRKKAEFDFELARCHDTYRLKYLLDRHIHELELINLDVTEMVKELENDGS